VLIYFINIANRTDRRAFMEEQFRRLGLEASRIAAVTPGDLTEADRRAKGQHWITGVLSDAALCCSISHRRALEAFLASGQAWALVLEDDAVLSARLPKFLMDFETTERDCLVVRIEAATHAHLTLRPTTILVDGIRLHRYTGWSMGAAAYVVSREGARMILADRLPLSTDIDVAIFHDVVELARRLRPLQASPALAVQAHNVEDIKASHRESDLAHTRFPTPKLLQLARAFHRDTVQAAHKAWWRFALGAKRTKVPFGD